MQKILEMLGQRILVLAAHPDDEVVACAAAIKRAQKQGSKVFVFYATHGCIGEEKMWPWQRHKYKARVEKRLCEAEKAAKILGIEQVNKPSRPARQLWRNLEEVCSEITKAIDNHKIDQIWVPAYEGGNADHDGLNAIGSFLSSQTSVLEFAEYNFFGGRKLSHEFPFPKGSEQILLLTEKEKREKLRLLKTYASEKGNLDYVRVEKECFRPLAKYDYSKPPHLGVLWYARFQWVPFRHPRVDFTKPEQVSAEITRFLEMQVKKSPGFANTGA